MIKRLLHYRMWQELKQEKGLPEDICTSCPSVRVNSLSYDQTPPAEPGEKAPLLS